MGFLSTIYGAALSGSPAAWLVLLGPILLVLIWLAAIWAFKAVAQKAADNDAQPAT